MAKLTKEGTTAMRNFSLMLVGSLALGYVALAIIGNPVVSARGDTPVVLAGDTLRFKAGSTDPGDNWTQVTPNQDYFYLATYKVRAVVLKKTVDAGTDGPDNDDINSHTDKTKTKIPKNASWRVDLFTGDTAVAHLEPQPNGIHIIRDVRSGALCPFENPIVRVLYSATGSCPTDPKDPAYVVTFSQIKITINGQPPPNPQPVPCQANGATVGHCKIVLRK
jgi:hypothetical protein